jgi:hypothetical protein
MRIAWFGRLEFAGTKTNACGMKCQYDLINKANTDLQQLTKNFETRRDLIRLLAQQSAASTAPPVMGSILNPYSLDLQNFLAENNTPETDPQRA